MIPYISIRCRHVRLRVSTGRVYPGRLCACPLGSVQHRHWTDSDSAGRTRTRLDGLGLGWTDSDSAGRTQTWLDGLGLGWTDSDSAGRTQTRLDGLRLGWTDSDSAGRTRTRVSVEPAHRMDGPVRPSGRACPPRRPSHREGRVVETLLMAAPEEREEGGERDAAAAGFLRAETGPWYHGMLSRKVP